MKNLSRDLKEIYDIVKKDIDIIMDNGYIVFSSKDNRVGGVIQSYNKDKCKALDDKRKYYVYVEKGSIKEISLIHLILKGKLYKRTAESSQQFFINMLEGANLSIDEYLKFGIPYEEKFIVYYVIVKNKEILSDAYDLLYNSFYDNESVWVFPYDSGIVLVQVSDGLYHSIGNNAMSIRDMINSEIYSDVYIGIGNINQGEKGITKSYEEAKQAIEVGKMFDIPQNIFIFNELIFERIIKAIPEYKFKEIYNEQSIEELDKILLDQEILRTIEIFFQHNLNISDSAKVLYIHRNTLIYRLEKIHKALGLDIKEFKDAVILKILLLLRKRYLKI